MRTDADFVADIRLHSERALQIVGRGRNAYDSDFAIQNALQFELLIIGEACTQLSPEEKTKHPEVAWRKIVGLRNRIVHAYFGTDLELIWSIATEFVPPLLAILVADEEEA